MLEFTPTELNAFRIELFKGFTDSQFDLAIAECQRRNLVPGQHIHFQLRNAKEWNPDIRAQVDVKKLTKVTTIEAFRLISERTGLYEGQGKPRWTYLDEKGDPTITSTIPLPDKERKGLPREPWTCVVPVYRKGFREPVEVEARFDAYAVTRKDRDGSIVLTEMWARRGPEQLAKCSEAAARRITSPEEFGSTYLREELERDDAHEVETVPVPVAVVEPPKVASVPTVNHTPAVPTDAPRPGEVRISPKLAEALAEAKSAAETTLVEILVPKAVPEILTPAANPAARKQRVKKATETFLKDNGRPLPKHEQPVEPNIPIGATDADLPAELFEHDSPANPLALTESQLVQQATGIDELSDNQRGGPAPNTAAAVQIMDDPPNKDEGKAITEKVRSYYVHGCKPDDLKNFSLKIAGKEKPSEIGKAVWKNIFGQLDAAFTKGGKTILLELIKPKPAVAEEVF
jgi:hypothetical protein